MAGSGIVEQGRVGVAYMKDIYGKEICRIGNVDRGLMDTSTKAQVIRLARCALRIGLPGGGYVFSASDSVYTGMPLERDQLVLYIWREEGNTSM